jgi:uncharacterized protein
VSIRTAPTLEEVGSRREEILRVLAARRARNPRIFGSVARGDAVGESDVDLLVDFEEPVPDGWDYFGMVYDLQQELSAILGHEVHVVEITTESRAAERVRREAVAL